MADPTLAQAWQAYRDLAIPADAGPGQFEGTRDAFHAGFASCYVALRDIVLAGVGEDEGSRMIDGLEGEIMAYALEIKARSAIGR
jgi:hypothetical protein